MNIDVKMYPAKNGDCFLISYGKERDIKKHLLIDGGYVDTINNYVIPDLAAIRDRGETLEKFIITHIDADHIQGAVAFLKRNQDRKVINVKQVWHNSYRHLFHKTDKIVGAKHRQIVQRIIGRGYPVTNLAPGGKPISAIQGTTAGALLLRDQYLWNQDFDQKAVCVEHEHHVILDEASCIVLLSPDLEKLEQLRKLWKSELNKYGINFDYENVDVYDDAFEMVALWEKVKSTRKPTPISAQQPTMETLLQAPFDEDNTATNGSSIAFMLEIAEKRLLMLADAHPDLIARSLQRYQPEGKVNVDLIKIAHHGSFCNINTDLLAKMDAPRYLISTNGNGHGHPDKETIAHIVNRQADFHRTLYFNYVTATSTFFEEPQLMQTYNYSVQYLNKAPYTITL